jgi:hypothetical protein
MAQGSWSESVNPEGEAEARRTDLEQLLRTGDLLVFNRSCSAMLRSSPIGFALCLMAKRNSEIDHVGLLYHRRDASTVLSKGATKKEGVEVKKELLSKTDNTVSSDPWRDWFVLEANNGGVTLRPLSYRLGSQVNTEIFVRRLQVPTLLDTSATNHGRSSSMEAATLPFPLLRQRWFEPESDMAVRFCEEHVGVLYKWLIFHFAASEFHTPDKKQLQRLVHWRSGNQQRYIRYRNALDRLQENLHSKGKKNNKALTKGSVQGFNNDSVVNFILAELQWLQHIENTISAMQQKYADRLNSPLVADGIGPTNWKPHQWFLHGYNNAAASGHGIFCSELCATFYQRLGLLPTSPTASTYVPCDFDPNRPNSVKLLGGSWLGVPIPLKVQGKVTPVSDVVAAVKDENENIAKVEATASQSDATTLAASIVAEIQMQRAEERGETPIWGTDFISGWSESTLLEPTNVLDSVREENIKANLFQGVLASEESWRAAPFQVLKICTGATILSVLGSPALAREMNALYNLKTTAGRTLIASCSTKYYGRFLLYNIGIAITHTLFAAAFVQYHLQSASREKSKVAPGNDESANLLRRKQPVPSIHSYYAANIMGFGGAVFAALVCHRGEAAALRHLYGDSLVWNSIPHAGKKPAAGASASSSTTPSPTRLSLGRSIRRGFSGGVLSLLSPALAFQWCFLYYELMMPVFYPYGDLPSAVLPAEGCESIRGRSSPWLVTGVCTAFCLFHTCLMFPIEVWRRAAILQGTSFRRAALMSLKRDPASVVQPKGWRRALLIRLGRVAVGIPLQSLVTYNWLI